MTTTGRPPRIPAAAQRLRLPLWQRSQARVRERYGFDLDAADAVERAQGLVEATPDDPERHLLLASALSTRGDSAAAETEVRRALELAPRLARAHTTLATLLVQRGEREEGLKAARNAAALDVDDPHVLYNLGLAEWFAGERKTARAAFERAFDALEATAAPDAPAPRRPWWQRRRQRG